MITTADIPGFFAKRNALDLEKYVLLHYWFETTAEPKLAAAALCSEQSTAQWARPGSKEDLRDIYGAKVVALNVEAESATPIYPDIPGVSGTHFTRVRVTVAHPWDNFGPKLPNLIAAVAGEGAFYCPTLTSIKLLDIEFPKSYLNCFVGPQFGVPGSREFLQVEDRPFFIGVVKPNLGLPPAEFAQLTYESLIGGLDIAKDDEMLGDVSWSPLAERAKEAGVARERASNESGSNKCYLAHIGDEVTVMPQHYQTVTQLGANAVMINPMCTGLSAITQLRAVSEVPIMGHFSGMAAISRMGHFGVSSLVWTKLMRLAGCDWIGLAGFGPRMLTTPAEVLATVQACLEPMGPIAPALPIPGGSDWAGTLPLIYQQVDTLDFGFISGRGVFGHPQGARAGAQSIVDAWEATRQNIPLQHYAETHPALAQALKAFN